MRFDLDASRDGGFDISQTGIAYAALSNIGTGITGLYTINLTLGGGAATLIGAIGDWATEVFALTILATDTDSDGIRDNVDICVSVSNSDQADVDLDGTGNLCDSPETEITTAPHSSKST